MTAPSIPTVDLEDLRSEDAARVRAAHAAIREAFGTYGLAYVKNHGVDQAGVARVFEGFRAFTKRPADEKEHFARRADWFQRGWTPPNTEVAVAGGGQPDFKECYFAAPYEREPELASQYPELFPENVWPEDAGAWREDYLAMGRALHEAGAALLRGAASALDLPAGSFTDVCEGGAHVTRVLHYLGLAPEQVDKGILWGEEHTDFNLLTLLPGGSFRDPSGAVAPKPDDRSGLFLRTRATPEAPSGTQVRGRPPEGCIIAQIGQQLEILTGGRFIATPHVITAPGVPGWTRDSAAHFVHANPNRVLYPLAPFLDDQSRRAYGPPVLAGTYAIKTLVDIGLAPPTAIEKLGYRHYDRLEAQRRGS
ncbi:MAG: isopenicillin N synthase family oxygenase [Labilithrix sp.]|nr:isopenicillin N synthase family oxygenase [Labilithrix sp.]